MRPNGEELLRGLQDSLTTYILPEVQTDHARLELMLAQSLLGVLARDWDGAAQRLVDENAALRALARRGADALGDKEFAVELRSLAGEADASVRLSDLSTANMRLREAFARLCIQAEGSETPALRELRRAVMEHLRAEAEDRSLSLLGPRADG